MSIIKRKNNNKKIILYKKPNLNKQNKSIKLKKSDNKKEALIEQNKKKIKHKQKKESNVKNNHPIKTYELIIVADALFYDKYQIIPIIKELEKKSLLDKCLFVFYNNDAYQNTYIKYIKDNIKFKFKYFWFNTNKNNNFIKFVSNIKYNNVLIISRGGSRIVDILNLNKNKYNFKTYRLILFPSRCTYKKGKVNEYFFPNENNIKINTKIKKDEICVIGSTRFDVFKNYKELFNTNEIDNFFIKNNILNKKIISIMLPSTIKFSIKNMYKEIYNFCKYNNDVIIICKKHPAIKNNNMLNELLYYLFGNNISNLLILDDYISIFELAYKTNFALSIRSSVIFDFLFVNKKCINLCYHLPCEYLNSNNVYININDSNDIIKNIKFLLNNPNNNLIDQNKIPIFLESNLRNINIDNSSEKMINKIFHDFN